MKNIDTNQALSNIYEDYKKAVKVIESCNYVEQMTSAIKYGNDLMKKHFQKNKLETLLFKNFGVIRSILNGTLKSKRRIAEFLTTVSNSLTDLANNESEYLPAMPRMQTIGYGSESSKIAKTIDEIKKYIEKQNEEISKPASDERIGYSTK